MLVTARHTLSLVTLCAAVAAAAPAQAQQIEPAPRRVALSPHLYLLGSPGAPRTEPEAQGAEPPARAGARAYLARHGEYVDLVGRQELVRAVRGQANYEQALSLARGFAELGLQRYKSLDPTNAIDNLEKARAGFARLRHELVAPEEVADVLLYLALSHLEQGTSPSRALALLREMILLDPTRELRAGYYPDEVVAAYQDARRALMRDIDRRGLPLELDELARDIARLTGSQDVLVGFVLPTQEGGWRVRLFPWRLESGRVERADALELSTLEEATLRRAGSRLAARYVDCLRQPVRAPAPLVPASSGSSPLSVGVHFSYATYLKFPQLELGSEREQPATSLRPFGNLGLNLSVLWALRQEFSLLARFQLLASQRDYSGFLPEAQEVSTLRGFVGGEFGFNLGRWRLALQLAADLTHIGDFRLSADPECNEVPGREFCGGPVVYDDYDLLVGLNTSPLVSVRVFRSLEVVARGSASYFFFSSSEADEINFPLSGEFGLRYRF